MSARKPPSVKGAKLDLTGGKWCVISLGCGADFLLTTPAAMKLLEQIRAAVPVERNYKTKGLGNHYTPISMIGRFELTVLSKDDTVEHAPGEGNADQA